MHCTLPLNLSGFIIKDCEKKVPLLDFFCKRHIHALYSLERTCLHYTVTALFCFLIYEVQIENILFAASSVIICKVFLTSF